MPERIKPWRLTHSATPLPLTSDRIGTTALLLLNVPCHTDEPGHLRCRNRPRPCPSDEPDHFESHHPWSIPIDTTQQPSPPMRLIAAHRLQPIRLSLTEQNESRLNDSTSLIPPTHGAAKPAHINSIAPARRHLTRIVPTQTDYSLSTETTCSQSNRLPGSAPLYSTLCQSTGPH